MDSKNGKFRDLNETKISLQLWFLTRFCRAAFAMKNELL
jgi:hypothetical protein